MKRLLQIIAAIIGIPLLGLTIYIVAYFTVAPGFSATVTQEANGDYRVDIKPNFVVYSITHIQIDDADGPLAELKDPDRGPQSITIPGPLPANHPITITCDMVYDRPMPSGATQSETIRLP